jgi:putative ABC transport system permease protein
MFDKLPTAWLQLRYQKARLLVALAGVVFAVLIVFMQFGLRDALFDGAVQIPKGLLGDSFLLSPRTTSFVALESFSERRLFQVLAFEEVEYVSPIYIGFAQWKNPETRNYWRLILVMGIDTNKSIVNFAGVQENLEKLKLPEQFLFDTNSRKEFGSIPELFAKQGEVVTELTYAGSNRKVNIVGLFTLGTSFGSDGSILTSDLNFLRLFHTRKKGLIDLGLIKLKPGTDVERFNQKLKRFLPSDVRVFSKQGLIDFEIKFWQSSTAIGFIFALGVALGLIVGIVFVYQILYSNISEHLSEYATLKAIGYRHKYLLSMVLQQAFFIAVIGYIPGFLLSVILYELTQKMTLLPIAMYWSRAVFVLFLTIAMSFTSGILAVRKLRSADPADIF